MTKDQMDRMRRKKVEILAPIIYATMKEGDTSAEAMEYAQKYSTDQTLCEMIVAEIELFEGETMNEDPGHQEAEEIYQQQEDEYYAGLADSES